MKKFLLLTAALVLFLTSFSACGEEVAPEFTDQYQLTRMIIPIQTATQIGEIAIPAKFNPATGSLTPLCNDPLCSHGGDSDCVFASMGQRASRSYYEDGWYYCFKDEIGTTEKKLMGIELATNRVEEIFDWQNIYNYLPEGVEAGSGGQLLRDGYFWGTLYKANSKEPLLCLRIELATRKIEEITPGGMLHIAKCEDTYIMAEPGEIWTGLWLADDVDGGNLRPIVEDTMIGITFDDLMDEGILLYAELLKDERGRYDWEHMILRAYDLETGEDTVLLDPFPDVYVAAEGDYIYYTLYMENPPLLGTDRNSGKEKYNRSGGILWRTNISTGETEKVFTEVEYSLDGVDIEAVGQYIIIGYTNVDYDNPTVTEDPFHGTFYDYPEETGRIVYDTVTGEHKIYSEGAVVNPSVVTHVG